MGKILIMLSYVSMLGCTQKLVDAQLLEEPDKDIIFISEPPPPPGEEVTYMEALFKARVHLEDGCIKLGGHNTIWPHYISFKKYKGEHVFLDGNEILFKLGDVVESGGGFFNPYPEIISRLAIPSKCATGKFFGVGEL